MSSHCSVSLPQVQRQVEHAEGVEAIKCNQLVALRVANESATALIFLQGAQVASYQPKGQKPVIWLSEHCDYTIGKPLRGGIPVCWPWFGDLSKNPQAIIDQVGNAGTAPAHGFVRDKEWLLDDAKRNDAYTTTLKFSLDVDTRSAEGWQRPCRLTLMVKVGAELEITFRVDNISALDLVASCALHSYFAVSNIARATVGGLAGIEYVDSLQDWQRYTQQGELAIGEEVDRIYQAIPQNVVLHDAGLSRTIQLSQSNAPSLVVWNPWLEKARRLSCFGHEDYLRMLCLETAQVLEHAQTIEAGGSRWIKLAIKSQSKFPDPSLH